MTEVLYATRTDDGGSMVITADPHECGWSGRITYFDSDGIFVRSGCAGCDEERKELDL